MELKIIVLNWKKEQNHIRIKSDIRYFNKKLEFNFLPCMIQSSDYRKYTIDLDWLWANKAKQSKTNWNWTSQQTPEIKLKSQGLKKENSNVRGDHRWIPNGTILMIARILEAEIKYYGGIWSRNWECFSCWGEN